MSVMKSKDGNDLMIDCCCGCNNGMRFRVFKEEDPEFYCFVTYTTGVLWSGQSKTIWRVIREKLKKIWAIIRSKDYYYSDWVMTKEEFEEFKEYINNI